MEEVVRFWPPTLDLELLGRKTLNWSVRLLLQFSRIPALSNHHNKNNIGSRVGELNIRTMQAKLQ